MNAAQNLDFQAVNTAVLANPTYLERRLPNAKRQGRELKAGDIHGAPGDSFSINTESGQWADFATDDRGGDPISFVAAQEGIGQGEAARLIADELGLPSPAPLARKSKELPEAPTAGIPTTIYTYFNPDGSQAYCVGRWEKDGCRKAIRPGAFDETGTFRTGLNGANPIPYNLVGRIDRPGVLESAFVVVVEGENKADALIDLGICATCNTGGAGKWKDEYASYFQGKAIVILPDNDKAGKDHAERVASSLASVAASVKVVELPGLPDKGDIVDWLKVPGNDIERLQALMNDAPCWRVREEEGRAFINLEDFLKLELRPREYILYPVLPEQGTAMLFAQRGIGKTYLALSMAYAVACGSPLFGSSIGPKWFAPKPRRVMYVDGEMAQVDMQDRLRSLVAGIGIVCPTGNMRLLTPDQLPIDAIMPNLATPKGQQWLEKQLVGVEMLVLDNLATLFGRQQENTAESWIPIQRWLLSLRRRGISVLIVHHAGKNGEQRDTSAKEDILNTAIRLRRPDDYMPEDGARFLVELTKARGICGADAAPFEAAVTMDGDRLVWVTKDTAHDELMAVVELIKAGKSIRAVSAELGVTAALVQRRQKKARNLGLL